MIRAVASKLDYSNDAFSFVQPSRNQVTINESKSEQLPARWQSSQEMKQRLKLVDNYKQQLEAATPKRENLMKLIHN